MSTTQPPTPTLKYRKSGPATAAAVATPPKIESTPRVARKAGVRAWEALFRAGIVVVIVVSLAMAYWSFFHRLVPLQKQARTMVSTVSTMSASLDELERRWTLEQAREIRARYREVYSQLFAGPAEVQEWLGQVHDQAAPLNLDIRVGFGQSTPHEDFADNLATIPASISMEARPVKTGSDSDSISPYQRVMAFSQALASHGKRADLAEFTVTGGPGSVSRAVLTFSLWAGDLGADAEEEADADTETELKTEPLK
jgi:hypothetical protein